jgi:hypothetical protein
LQLSVSGSETNRDFAMVFFMPIELPNASDRLIATQDLAWALINAKEFVFRN